MKKKKGKQSAAEAKANAAFIEKISSLTFGTGAKNEPPSWVPKVYNADGKEMKCVSAGVVKLRKVKLEAPPPDTSHDDSFAA